MLRNACAPTFRSSRNWVFWRFRLLQWLGAAVPVVASYGPQPAPPQFRLPFPPLKRWCLPRLQNARARGYNVNTHEFDSEIHALCGYPCSVPGLPANQTKVEILISLLSSAPPVDSTTRGSGSTSRLQINSGVIRR
jgi:hypothetical protein